MKALIIGFLLTLGGLFMLAPASVSASVLPDSSICSQASGSAVCQDKTSSKSNPITGLIGKITELIAVVAGIVAVIMIIISGFRFVVSGGESNAVAGARKSLTFAIVGAVVIALASTIISFIMGKI